MVLLICLKRLTIELKIFSSIFMQIFTLSSLKLVCHPVKSWSIKPFIVPMTPNQAGKIYIFTEFVGSLLSGGYAMYLIFDQSVDLYKSNLVIDIFALLTHLGGDVGFCKEVLWILFIIFSGFDYARRYCLKTN